MSEERRLVTVLFADVIGSTSMGEALDPEDLRLLLRRYYAIAHAVVNEFGGTLEKFIGDAVVAIFGLPRAHDDDAERAAAAAVRLRDRVRQEPGLGERLPIRIGINTGRVVANLEQVNPDFVVTGDAVNVAARLQQAAEPWSILAGDRTAHAARNVRFGTPRTLEARGHSPIVAREVLEVGARESAPVRRLPLFGREQDLQQLELITRRVVADARPFVVSVLAPPGTGKTRLLDAYLERLPEHDPGAGTAVARCLPYGERLTYWPVRSMLLQLLELPETATSDEVRQRIDEWLTEIGVETGRTGRLLAATIGIGEAEPVDTTELLVAWRTALEAAARRQPLVIAFDDLHWASESMLELVEFVTQPRGEARLLIIALARPELLDRRPGWGGGRRNFVSLTLEPLDERAMGELLTHLLESPSNDLVSAVRQRAQGNPFYASEIVRSVIDRVGSTDDPAAVREALAALPDTVHATLLARLDLLPAESRRVLQLGSVFGNSFQEPAVAALDAGLAPQLARRLEYLADRELVEPRGGGEHEFRHILIREAAYETLPRVERARLHASAAEWLDAHGGADLTELIAYHYREAATLPSPLEREELKIAELRRRAVEWLIRAAEKAESTGATPEVRGHLLAAIELADAAALPDLYERLGDATLQGEHSVEAYGVALRLVREQGRSPKDELRVLGKLVMVYTRAQGSVASRPSVEELERLRDEGRRLLAVVDDDEARASFLIGEGFFPFWDDRYTSGDRLTEASRSAEAGLELATRLDEPNLRSAALDALAGIAESTGDWSGAVERSRARLVLADRLSLLERIDAHSMITWGLATLGDLEEADEVSAAGLALAQPGQLPSWRLHLLAWRTYALMLRGRWDEALVTAEEARRTWQEGGLGSAGYALRGFMAALDVARARRDLPLAERLLAVLRAILKYFAGDDRPHSPGRASAYVEDDAPGMLRQLVDTLGPAFDAGGSGERAVLHRGTEGYERLLARLADRGMPLPSAELLRGTAAGAAELGYRPIQGQALRALGLVTGDPDAFRPALNIFRSIGAQPYAARVQAELAILEDDAASFSNALQALAALGDLEQQERYLAIRSG